MPSNVVALGSPARSQSFGRVETHHLILAGVAGAALLLYAYTTMRYGDTFMTADSYLYYVHAHSWYFDGDADYENDLLAAPRFAARQVYLSLRSADGHVVIIHPCAWSVVSFGFIALADGVTVLHNALLHAHLPRDGYSGYYIAIVPLAHVLVGLMGLLAAYAVAARYYGKTISAVATSLVWIGTNVCYFISVEPTMAHAASMAFIAMMIWVVDTIRRRGFTLQRACLLGLTCGMMTAVRYYNIVWVVVPAVLIGPSLVSDCLRRRPGAIRRIGFSSFPSWWRSCVFYHKLS